MDVGAQSLDPALLAQEMGHFFGAAYANLGTPAGPRECDDQFCIMGREGGRYGLVHTPLNRLQPDGSFDTALVRWCRRRQETGGAGVWRLQHQGMFILPLAGTFTRAAPPAPTYRPEACGAIGAPAQANRVKF